MQEKRQIADKNVKIDAKFQRKCHLNTCSHYELVIVSLRYIILIWLINCDFKIFASDVF